jgi:hypothetical protein
VGESPVYLLYLFLDLLPELYHLHGLHRAEYDELGVIERKQSYTRIS